MKEVWKDVESYEGLYQVSNFGRVKSLTHYIIKENCKPREIKGKILTSFFDRPKGYLSVSLSKNNKIKLQRIHRLVAQAFIPNPNNLIQINHKDGNKSNNNVENLEWCSCKDNIRHAWENKLSYVSEKHRKVASETQKKRWEEYRKNKANYDVSMKEEISLDIEMSKEEMAKIKELLTSLPELRHYAFQLKNGEYLDLVEYKDYEKLEEENKSLQSQLKEKEEVIKEAREYNQKIADDYLKEDDCEYCDGRYATATHNLEILSKGENKC